MWSNSVTALVSWLGLKGEMLLLKRLARNTRVGHDRVVQVP